MLRIATGLRANVQELLDIDDEATTFHMQVVNVQFPTDLRVTDPTDTVNRNQLVEGFGVGNIFECAHNPDVSAVNRLPAIDVTGHTLRIRDLYFSFDDNRTFFVQFNDTGARGASSDTTVAYFHTRDCRTIIETEVRTGVRHVVTEVLTLYDEDGLEIDGTGIGNFPQNMGGLNNDQEDFVGLCHLGKEYQDYFIGDPEQGLSRVSIFDQILAESQRLGPVFQSKKRISQHLCAPVLNPNMRIGCTAPLNFETGHLPPELRDFRLELRDVDFSFLPGKVSLEPLMLYEFNGGNQVVAAEDNLLHLPQFREKSVVVREADGTFDFEMFSPLGMPSFIALFCRDQDRSRDYMDHPLIKQLSIMCTTTQKKSNTILEADVHQLYHITQRNVNHRARYNRDTFNKRQVVLLRAEDVGLMGLETYEYQKEKRATFRFSGTVDSVGRLTVVLIFNNRGLYVQGKHMSVVRLRE